MSMYNVLVSLARPLIKQLHCVRVWKFAYIVPVPVSSAWNVIKFGHQYHGLHFNILRCCELFAAFWH